MYISLPFCAPASSSDKISKSQIWSDHIGCLALFSFTRLGLSFSPFLSGWQLFGLSHLVRDLGRNGCIMCLSPLHFYAFHSFPSLGPYTSVCPSFWSKQYLSLSYRAKQIRQTQTPLHYAIQLHHKQKREYSAAPRGLSSQLSRSILF